MGIETFVNYWIGQEPTPPSPSLGDMPAAVDVAPLAFVNIDDQDGQYVLDFDFLCSSNPASEIKAAIDKLRSNGTRVLLSILDAKLATVPDVDAFAAEVADQAVEWGVDGIDLDYEPPGFSPGQQTTLLALASALRSALSSALDTRPLLTAPIYAAWSEESEFLREFAAELDFVTTMDYSPWPGLSSTQEFFEKYSTAIGDPEKIAIGVSCMGPADSPNFTPIEDVEAICQWEPPGGTKRGVMLYTFSYDVTRRTVERPKEAPRVSGTRLPDATFTNTIIDNLP
jgi:hypothetical protein